MTKKIISAGVFALVILALGAVLYIINANPPAAAESSAYEPVEVLYVIGQAEAKRVESLVVDNANGGFEINVGNAEAEKTVDIIYDVKGLENTEGDRTALASVVNSSAKLIGTTVVSEDSSSLSSFGLDKPSVTAKVKYTDGSEGVILIGNSAPAGAGYYAKSSQGDRVYLVSNSNVEKFFFRAYDFFSTVITLGDPEVESILAATLSGTVRAEPIIINVATKEQNESTMLTTHFINRPVVIGMDAEKGLAALRFAFGMTAESVIGTAVTDDEKAKYGLAEPYSTLALETQPDAEGNKLKFTLSASEPGADGKVNLMSDSGSLVYSMAASDISWLNVQVFDLMSKQVILPHINKVETLTIKTQESETVFNIEGEDENMKVTSNDITLDNDSFRKFYQSVISARYDSIPEGPVPENAPFYMSYTYKYRDGRKSDVVTFRQGPARALYIDLNGGETFCIPSSYTDKVLEDIPKILAGQKVTSYI